MKKIALVTSLIIGGTAALSAGELENLKASNVQKNRQIDSLEKEIDHLYKLLDKQNREGARRSSTRTKTNGTYIVVSGDSLSKIARQHKISLSNLMKANNLNHRSVLRIGQKLSVPKKAEVRIANAPVKQTKVTSTEEKIPRATVVQLAAHTVAKGDTFYSIARRHKVSVNSLKSSNPGIKPSALRIGQKVTIPANKALANRKQTKAPQATAKNTKLAAQAPFSTIKQVPVNNTPVKKKKPVTISTTNEPEVMKSIYLDKPIRFSDLAKKYNTTVAALNELNDWSYPGSITLARGSEIYLPN